MTDLSMNISRSRTTINASQRRAGASLRAEPPPPLSAQKSWRHASIRTLSKALRCASRFRHHTPVKAKTHRTPAGDTGALAVPRGEARQGHAQQAAQGDVQERPGPWPGVVCPAGTLLPYRTRSSHFFWTNTWPRVAALSSKQDAAANSLVGRTTRSLTSSCQNPATMLQISFEYALADVAEQRTTLWRQLPSKSAE